MQAPARPAVPVEPSCRPYRQAATVSEGTASAAAAGRWALSRGLTSSLVALLVTLELGEGRREGVLPAGARLHDVVQVADARRPGGSLDRRQAGVADRAGRQTRMGAGVVGRVDRELALGQ